MQINRKRKWEDENLPLAPHKKQKSEHLVNFLQILPHELISYIFSFCNYQNISLINKKFYFHAIRSNYQTSVIPFKLSKKILCQWGFKPKVLGIAVDRLSVSKLKMLNRATQLKSLSLIIRSNFYKNRIVNLNHLSTLVNLESLSIESSYSYDKTVSFDPLLFKSLKKLKVSAESTLNMNLNVFSRLTSLTFTSFCYSIDWDGFFKKVVTLTNLHKLSINKRLLMDEDQAEFSLMTNLTSLTLKNIDSEFLFNSVSLLVNLGKLKIKSVNLPLTHLKNLTKLHHLQFQDCYTFENVNFSNLSLLTQLSLKGGALWKINFENIMRLTRLLSLDLSDTIFTSNEDYFLLTHLTGLVSLDLSHNHSIDFSWIKKLSNLRHLTVCESNLKKTIPISKSLPDLMIHFSTINNHC